VAEQRQLAILRERVRREWIRDVLEGSLFRRRLIELDIKAHPEAVEPVITRLGHTRQCVTSCATLPEIYKDNDSSLLILGAPGAGNTAALLGLTRTLIYEATADSTKPIPVIFNLSTWSDKQPPLDLWLLEELNLRYRVPQRQSNKWLKEGWLILLLDGLDEVSTTKRATCVEAIRRYSNPIPGIVVTCRLEEYVALPLRLNFEAAVCLHPLSVERVDSLYGTSRTPVQ
jgi:eukaryotic-like serine/threonine-protein kinase